MLQCLMMFLAPASAPAQATPTAPPAAAEAGRNRPARGRRGWKLTASVLANAAGFLAMLAGCWLMLLSMQVLLLP